MSDINEDDMKDWAGAAFDRNREPIMNSELFAVMFSGGRDDALQCLQLGMAIMMNKPIIVVADGDVPIPKALERLAVKVTRAQFNDPEAMARAIKEITEDDK